MPEANHKTVPEANHKTLRWAAQLVIGIVIGALGFFAADRISFGERTGEDRGATRAQIASLERDVERKVNRAEFLVILEVLREQLTKIDQRLDRIERRQQRPAGEP